MKKKILIYADSLGLPRIDKDGVKWHETWVQLLKQNSFYEVEYFAMGGGKISDLYQQNYYSLFDPDIVLIQSGIVDCASRALSEFEKILLKRVPILNRFFKEFLTPERTIKWRRKRNIKLTPEKEFAKYVKAFLKFYGERLVWIGILPASESYGSKVPLIDDNVKAYNNIIKSILKGKYIDLTDFPKNCFLNDYHHPNVAGHRFIYNKIFNFLQTQKQFETTSMASQ